MTEKPAPLSADLVRAFVIAGHGDLDQVKAMLAKTPSLINVAWDWGDGDFETALGGAAHVGQREVALHLLARGARFDLYAAAMLGQLEVVKAILTANPAARFAPGAHGIPLLAHALRGGAEAAAVVDYLNSLPS
ncbi:MAG: hypothetical protein IT317_05610 [Anaerolineales bacterium]|nr:hypothetical protein [Anaerolineales bacterium]